MVKGVKIVKKKPITEYIMEEPSLNTLFADPDLEEIMINGPKEPVFVYHTIYGQCRTNLQLSSSELLKLIQEIAKKAGETISPQRPFMDARLPDGSRANATLKEATPEGPTLTVRKFRSKPFSIVDLIKAGTLTPELGAFLWMAVEGEGNYPLNTIVIGGTGSGKTTTLNTLITFIPPKERIICIEDTMELNFAGRINFVRMESYPGDPVRPPLTMNQLLINALRMRPDRLIVGEVRGKEAETLFNAMNVGHSAMGTLHANSPAEFKTRLTNPPMNVPKDMLPLIDLVITQARIRTETGLKRRIISVTEVTPGERTISFNKVYEYDPKTDVTVKTDVPSIKEQELAKLSGLDITEIKEKTREKQEIIELLMKKEKMSFEKVQEVMYEYYYEE